MVEFFGRKDLKFFGRIFRVEFFGGFFWEDFFGRIFWEEFFGRISLGGIDVRNYLVEINKELKFLQDFA